MLWLLQVENLWFSKKLKIRAYWNTGQWFSTLLCMGSKEGKERNWEWIIKIAERRCGSQHKACLCMCTKICNTKNINFESKQENHCIKNFSCFMIADMLNAYKGLRIKHDKCLDNFYRRLFKFWIHLRYQTFIETSNSPHSNELTRAKAKVQTVDLGRFIALNETLNSSISRPRL